LGFNPVIVLVKLPVPVPFEVLLFAVVGFGVTLQQTPRLVTDDPPSFVIFPPLIADVVVMEDKNVVESVGGPVVVKFI
jgi:hypothetical protein